jgi:transposase
MAPGTPFDPGIRSLLNYLHHNHHVSFERLPLLAAEMFGLTISQGAIANVFRRLHTSVATGTNAICDRLRTARIIASDEAIIRTNDASHQVAAGVHLGPGGAARDRPAPGEQRS